MIWSNKIEWLQSTFSDTFISILITTKIDFSFKIRINWSRLWHSCCVSSNHQKLLWNWQSWLIISWCWILKCRILLLCLILSVVVVFLWRSFILLINWHQVRLRIWNIFRWLIVKIRIVERFHWYYYWFEISLTNWLKIHEHRFSVKALILHDFNKFLLDDDFDKLQNMNSHFHIDFLSCDQQDTVFNLTADHHMMNSFCNVNINKDLILHILTNISKLKKLS